MSWPILRSVSQSVAQQLRQVHVRRLPPGPQNPESASSGPVHEGCPAAEGDGGGPRVVDAFAEIQPFSLIGRGRRTNTSP